MTTRISRLWLRFTRSWDKPAIDGNVVFHIGPPAFLRKPHWDVAKGAQGVNFKEAKVGYLTMPTRGMGALVI